MDEQTLSIIIPCYNEENNVEEVVEKLYEEIKKYDITFEILIFNDCSNDRTGEILDTLEQKYPEVKAFHNKQNRGIGYIFKKGVEVSKFERITLLPSDGQFKTDEIKELYDKSLDSDILITYHKNPNDRSFIRRIFSRSYHGLVRTIFNIPFSYFNWINIYKKEIFNDIELEADKFTYSAEVIIKAYKLGYKIDKTYSYLQVRDSGKSSAVRISSILNAIISVIKLWLNIYIINRKKFIK